MASDGAAGGPEKAIQRSLDQSHRDRDQIRAGGQLEQKQRGVRKQDRQRPIDAKEECAGEEYEIRDRPAGNADEEDGTSKSRWVRESRCSQIPDGDLPAALGAPVRQVVVEQLSARRTRILGDRGSQRCGWATE